MNKEVIYLEPEDDITDILTKLQQAEQKLVALVPPKKATILRSAVNMKLVARVAKECEKVAVIVTADPAIVKMAMLARIPVAKTLQSRPVLPTEENVKAAEQAEEVIDEEEMLADQKASEKPKKDKMPREASNSPSDAQKAKSAMTLDIDEETLENGSKTPEKGKSPKSAKKPHASASGLNFLQKNRKMIIAGAAIALVAVVFLVWAFVFAPAVTIAVTISSIPNNFSENINFTTDESAQDLAANLLYAEEIRLEKTYKTDIAATGREDRGEKATGTISVSATFTPYSVAEEGYTLAVPAGARFTNTGNQLSYIATESEAKSWNGDDPIINCDSGTLNVGASVSNLRRSCTFTVTVAVEAEEAGEEYDISASTRWQQYQGANVSNGAPIAGGTSHMVTVISAEDIDKVREIQLAEHTTEGREDLFADVRQDLVPIEASFAGEVVEIVTTPEQGAEVESGEKTTAEVKIAYTAYALKRTTIEAYIDQKLAVAADQKIYSYGSPYIERFTGIENEARLKTVVETGPTLTEEEIFEKVKGRKIGEVRSLLVPIDGIDSVTATAPYFWVSTVPTDSSRVTIKLEAEEKA